MTESLCADKRCEHPQGWHRLGVGSCLECGCTGFLFGCVWVSERCKWQMQEAGWHTSDIGGICKEADGWAFWPNDLSWPTIRGLPTLGAAMAEAERLARVKDVARLEERASPSDLEVGG